MHGSSYRRSHHLLGTLRLILLRNSLFSYFSTSLFPDLEIQGRAIMPNEPTAKIPYISSINMKDRKSKKIIMQKL